MRLRGRARLLRQMEDLARTPNIPAGMTVSAGRDTRPGWRGDSCGEVTACLAR